MYNYQNTSIYEIGEVIFMDNIQDITWIFSGIGTEIISNMCSMVLGGLIGYKIGTNQTVHQKQTAGTNAKQNQTVKLGNLNNKDLKQALCMKLNQNQKAGDYSIQQQMGDIKNDE